MYTSTHSHAFASFVNTEWLYDVYVYNFPFIPLSIHTLNGPHALIEILTFSSLA